MACSVGGVPRWSVAWQGGNTRAAGRFVYGFAVDLGSEERVDRSERRGASGILGRVGSSMRLRVRKGKVLRQLVGSIQELREEIGRTGRWLFRQC